MPTLSQTDNVKDTFEDEWRRELGDPAGYKAIDAAFDARYPTFDKDNAAFNEQYPTFKDRYTDPDAWHVTQTARAIDFLTHRAAPARRSLKTHGYYIADTLYAYGQNDEESFALFKEHWNHGVFRDGELKDFCEYPYLEEFGDIGVRSSVLREVEAEMTPEDHSVLRSYECGETLTAAQWAAYDQARDRENTIWRHAMKNRTAPATLDESVAAWNQIMAENQPATTNKKSSLYVEHFDALQPRFDRLGLVKGLLDHEAMSVLYGDSWVGKTLVALSLGYHISSGQPWWGGRPVQHGLVVYVAAEGGYGVRNRLVALRTHYGTDYPATLALIPCPIDLSGHGADVQPLLDVIAEVGRPSLIVIDTLSRALYGGNENSPEDMGAFIKNADRLRASTGAHLLALHHSGKDQAKGSRGHSSLKGATDTELEVIHDQKTGARKILIRKQRDIDALFPIGFAIESVAIGTDPEGAIVSAPFAVHHDLQAEGIFGRTVRADSVAGRALTIVEHLTMGTPAISSAAWREEFVKIHYPENRKTGWNAFQRASQELQKAGLVVEKEGQISRGE